MYAVVSSSVPFTQQGAEQGQNVTLSPRPQPSCRLPKAGWARHGLWERGIKFWLGPGVLALVQEWKEMGGSWMLAGGVETSPFCPDSSCFKRKSRMLALPSPPPFCRGQGLGGGRRGLWAAEGGGGTGGGSDWTGVWQGGVQSCCLESVAAFVDGRRPTHPIDCAFATPTFMQGKWVSWVSAPHLVFKSLVGETCWDIFIVSFKWWMCYPGPKPCVC